jgi:hypothetical protein
VATHEGWTEWDEKNPQEAQNFNLCWHIVGLHFLWDYLKKKNPKGVWEKEN